MNIIEDITPLSTFKQKSGDVIDHIKSSKRPTFITINGTVQLVIQDAESYQEMVDTLERYKDLHKISTGLDEIKIGKGVSVTDGFAKLRKKYK